MAQALHKLRLIRPAFTVVELLVVVTLLAIIALLTFSSFGDEQRMKLRGATRVLIADLEHAQTLSLGQPHDACAMTVNPNGSGYWIALASTPEMPINDPKTGRRLFREFGAFPLHHLAGVQVVAAAQAGAPAHSIAFGSLGELKDPFDATITLGCGDEQFLITLDHVLAQCEVSEEAP